MRLFKWLFGKNPVLPKNRITYYNGIEVKWFIGDVNPSKAKQLGLLIPYSIKHSGRAIFGNGEGYIIDNNGAYWEAWGSVNGHPYQLFAWYNRATRELSDVTVCPPTHLEEDREGNRKEVPSYGYHEATYKMLTSR